MLFGYTIGCSEFDATNLVGCYHFIFQRLLVEQLLIKNIRTAVHFSVDSAKQQNQVTKYRVLTKNVK